MCGIWGYLAKTNLETLNLNHPQFIQDIDNISHACSNILQTKGKQTVDEIHKNLGKIM